MMPQQFDLLKASAITQIQDDLESAVEADRILAETAATTATTQAGISTDSAASAQASAIAAGAPIFADTTDGLAGTSSGEFFYVPEFGGLRAYENDAGTAVAGPFVGQPVFALRATLVAAIAAGYAPTVGTVVPAGRLSYEFVGGSDDPLGGLPGWVEFGLLSVAHTGAACDGTTDDTAAVEAARDYAVSQGIRAIDVPSDTYAPGLTNTGLVQFTGEGRITGARWTPTLQGRERSGYAPRVTISPFVHLKQFVAPTASRVAFIGDSTTVAGDAQSKTESLPALLRHHIARCNPNRDIEFFNAGIGGTSFNRAAEYQSSVATALVAPEGFSRDVVGWYTDGAKPWLEYVEDFAPDVLFINWGTNDAPVLRHSEIQAVVDVIQTWAKVPDLVFLTNNPYGLQATPTDRWGTETLAQGDQNDRHRAAGMVRAYAEFEGYGYIDVHRAGCIARDGFDPCAPVFTRTLAGSTITTPHTLAETWEGLDLRITHASGTGLFSVGNFEIAYERVNAGSAVQNLFGVRLSNVGGTIRYQVIGDGIKNTDNAFIDSGFAVPAGALTIHLSNVGGMMRLDLDDGTVAGGAREGARIFERPVLAIGGYIRPVLRYVGANAAVATDFTVDVYSRAEPLKVRPWLRDDEAYGPVDLGSPAQNPQGGNGRNHPASHWFASVTRAAIEACDLSAPSFNEVTITGGSINGVTIGQTDHREATFSQVMVGKSNESTLKQYILNGLSTAAKRIRWNTNAVARWDWLVVNAETGGDSGSVISLRAYNDSGTSLGDLIRGVRTGGGRLFFPQAAAAKYADDAAAAAAGVVIDQLYIDTNGVLRVRIS